MAPDDVILESLSRARAALDSGVNPKQLRWILRRADADLKARLLEIAGKNGASTFSAAQAIGYRKQIALVTKYVEGRLQGLTHELASKAVASGLKNTTKTLAALDHAFTGVAKPLMIAQAARITGMQEGVDSSLLARHKTSVDRYGKAMIIQTETMMARGMLIGLSQHAMINALVASGGPGGLFQKNRYWAERIVRTETAHAYNAANLQAIHHARNLDFPDLGKKILATFDLRTACLIGSTRVRSGVVRAVFRRWYEGPVVEIVTEGGRNLSATPNHPMLTQRGWVGAGELRDGDDLVCDDGQQHSGASGDKHVTNDPPTLDQVFDAALISGHRDRRLGRDVDFHGDGSQGEIDVVFPNGELCLGRFSALGEPLAKKLLSPAYAWRWCEWCGALLGRGEGFAGLGASTQRNPSVYETTSDRALRCPEPAGDAFERFASHISLNDVTDGNVGTMVKLAPEGFGAQGCSVGHGPRDTTLAESLGDIPEMGTHDCGHAAQAESGSVQLDRLVGVKVTSFRGYVFNLATHEGYYNANGLHTGNCDSVEVHGQVRPHDGLFMDGAGRQYQHPPARPNDRETVIPWRMHWPETALTKPVEGKDAATLLAAPEIAKGKPVGAAMADAKQAVAGNKATNAGLLRASGLLKAKAKELSTKAEKAVEAQKATVNHMAIEARTKAKMAAARERLEPKIQALHTQTRDLQSADQLIQRRALEYLKQHAQDRDDSPGGFSRAPTHEVATALNISTRTAYKALHALAKGGQLVRAGRVPIDKGVGFQGKQTGSGWQLWEVSAGKPKLSAAEQRLEEKKRKAANRLEGMRAADRAAREAERRERGGA